MPVAMRAQRATYSMVDFTEVAVIGQNFRRAATYFGKAMAAAKPEFGAYMRYSYYLELGTVKMQARPHIVPAVADNAQLLVDTLCNYMLDHLDERAIKGRAAGTYKKAYEDAWWAVLNGPMRIAAVAATASIPVYEFGFHRRSINGSVHERSPEEIRGQMASWEAERIAAVKAAAKKLTSSKGKGKA